MRKIKTLSTLEKALALIVAIGAAWTVLGGIYDHFEKSSAARAEHAALEQHQVEFEEATYKALKQDRVDRLERENQRIKVDLANPHLEEWERNQAKENRAENNLKIECIRKDEC